ncbi:pleckstrin homology domain-containing family A member 8 isoform X3 [Gadus macrocephalus]|uniref:pleckstrin homology domain-containing family A member 8 isoform X3 n=1 Tax=Gadus macrocephalus TaxID=80720 RepID=UPI0028CBB23F|nr:pleckstrin homology domain-containing family A member 8 isoform X3 [Gadus macrocephalus]
MEGILHKWTNYISGWQPRWFVLDGGTLSYYDSQEDAWKGCKGSIKISVCEILVHSTDITRVDLTIPGEQYFYLRAINAAERQKWLVALGTAKACLTDNRTRREKELQENTEAIKTKMSELRLYCDLLLKQVNKIKDSEERGDSAEAGEDTGIMVKSTCTTFLKTLEECMQIANHTFSSDMVSQSPPGSPPVAAIKPQKIKPLCHLKLNLGEKLRESEEAHENQSQDSGREGAEEPEKPDIPSHRDQAPSTALEEDDGPPAPYTAGPVTQLEGEGSNPEQEQKHNMDQIKEDGEDEVSRNQREMVSALDQILPPQDPLLEEEGVDTFFSTMSHRFSDIRLEDDRGIPTQDFLDSCYAIVPVLDKLGSTVFAPVKMDFVGNIKTPTASRPSSPSCCTSCRPLQHRCATRPPRRCCGSDEASASLRSSCLRSTLGSRTSMGPSTTPMEGRFASTTAGSYEACSLPESLPVLRVLHRGLSIPGGGPAEAGLHQRHAAGP